MHDKLTKIAAKGYYEVRRWQLHRDLKTPDEVKMSDLVFSSMLERIVEAAFATFKLKRGLHEYKFNIMSNRKPIYTLG